MKESRQKLILDAIQKADIETQNQLIDVLREAGINATQATISRDIKELHLVKELTPWGVYRYVTGAGEVTNLSKRLQTIFKECVTSIATAQNIIGMYSGSIDYEYKFHIDTLTAEKLQWSFTYRDGHSDTWTLLRVKN